ncbi:MAG: LuxR family transcriptional regulator, partial [Mycobacterium sp.]
MMSPALLRPADLAASSREAIAAVDADPGAPARFLVTGGIGTGKSTVLAAIRASFREAGRAVHSQPPGLGDAVDAAIVVDDAHLLSSDDLDRLTELVADPAATVVIGSQPLAHHPALSRLTTALERENPAVVLGPLPPIEVGRAAAAVLGTPATPDLVRALISASAGLPFLLRPALSAAGDGPSAVRQAARFALIERLRRLDERVLDTLLISSLSPDLGPDDVAAALRMSSEAASAAVDRARSSGLIDPSHASGFLPVVHDSIAQILGAARHHEIEVAVLCSQVELSTLTADLALRLAEHGLREERLATALTDLAERVRDHPADAARLY